MADKIEELLEKNGQMIIDGSMSTALEQMGANLNCSLWTARALVDTPELVKEDTRVPAPCPPRSTIPLLLLRTALRCSQQFLPLRHG